MKKLLLALKRALGFARNVEAEPAIQMIDPKEVLFSVPTIARDLPPLEPLSAPPAADAFMLHEDDWTQTEFLPLAMLPEIRRILSELKSFDAQNREGSGWRNLYVREFGREPLLIGAAALEHLKSVIGAGAGPAPLLTSAGGVACVRNGFTVEIGRNVTLYGHADESGIAVLAASLGVDPDDQKLTETFMKLSASDGLVLVDWRQQMLLLATSDHGKVAIWRP